MTVAPDVVSQDLSRLSRALDAAIAPRTPSNLLVATWNVRAFGDLTQKWLAVAKDSPKRDWHAVACIAEIVSRFDVVALQEIRRSTQALKFLLVRLGPNWRVIVSDVTEGAAGNGERLAFLYRSDRVQPSGLVGEIVLPPVGDYPQRQFARTPYIASFSRAGTEFTLASVHVLWGKNPAERLPEVTAFAHWMRAWADRTNDWNKNLMVLGDFNLDRIGDPLYEAFINTGLWPPTELNNVPRTIFDDDNTQHFYDQIAVLPARRHVAPAGHDLHTKSRVLRFHSPHNDRTDPERDLLADLGPLPPMERIPPVLKCCTSGMSSKALLTSQ